MRPRRNTSHPDLDTRRIVGVHPCTRVVPRIIQEETTVSEYVQFGAILITVPNLIVIITMIVVFAVGLWLKLPSHSND